MNFLEIKKLKTLINLVIDSGITELEVSEEGKSIRINNSKMLTSNAAAQLTIDAANLLASNTPVQPPIATRRDSSDNVESQEKKEVKHTVNAPMVGTVYLSSAPGTKAFVEIGQQVKMGETLCLIEAMKMFNRIEADKDGVVTAKLVENAQPVEYGQALFIIE